MKVSNVEEMFKSISERFEKLSSQIETVNKVIESIGATIGESMVQISEEVNGVTESLQNIMKVSDLKNVKDSIHDIVGTFREELDPIKIQKLIKDLTQAVKILKQSQK
jgi:methyl-accepting chemotaxis protein